MLKAGEIWSDLSKIRREAPLIHNITNYVVMNTTANALLSLGAAPFMAHAEKEVLEMTKISRALVVNIGTLCPDWISAIKRAMQGARQASIPVIFDPVGVGATTYRTETAKLLLSQATVASIRGNPSEISALAEAELKPKPSPAHNPTNLDWVYAVAASLASHLDCVVCVGGKIDFITDGRNALKILNGDPLMSKVTGLGSTASAMIAPFCAVNEDFFQATAHAMAVVRIAGEMAAESAAGPGSLQVNFYDVLHNLTAAQIRKRLKQG